MVSPLRTETTWPEKSAAYRIRIEKIEDQRVPPKPKAQA